MGTVEEHVLLSQTKFQFSKYTENSEDKMILGQKEKCSVVYVDCVIYIDWQSTKL